MAATDNGTALAEAFEEHRGRLTAVASRMLGSRTDAEDAVQEAWLRFARQDEASIDNLGGWLTTVVSRVCIDMLRSRATKRETALDDQLNWIVTEDDGTSPERNAVLADSVGAALQVVLDTLGPDERLAFVLHDLFAVPFADIGEIIDKSTDAAKMLASRARRKVRGAEHPTDVRRQREVVDAFMAAAKDGDFDELLRVLHPDLTWRVHTQKGTVVRRGAAALAGFAQQGTTAQITVRRMRVDGVSGIVGWRPNGKPFVVIRCTVVGDQITVMESIIDPDRLAELDIPQLPV